MIKQLLPLLILVILPRLSESQKENTIQPGRKYEVYSKVLKESRTFYIYNTVKGNDSGYYKNNLPVIYVLDGEDQFLTAVTIAKYFAENEEHAPKVLVVGIWNTDRNRDFTPSYDSTIAIKNAGGSNNFATFLKKELFPYIESNFHSGSTRTLIGHSFAGLFGMTALTRFPDLFADYILIDPSCWWHKQQIVKELLHEINSDRYSNKSLFISIANTLPAGQDSITVRNMNPDSVAMTSEFNFVDQLKLTSNKVHWSYKYFPNENHWTVALLSMYEGLRYIYKEHWNH